MNSITICVTIKKSASTDKYFNSSLKTYLNQNYSNFKVLIIDGSNYPAYKKKIKQLDRNHLIKYLNIPDNSSYEGYVNAFNHIDTDYVMFGTVSDGLITNDWLSVAMYNIKNSVAIFGLSRKMDSNDSLFGPDDPNLINILNDNFLDNLIFCIGSQYIPPELNLVYRFDFIKKIFKKKNKSNIHDLFLFINSYLINNNFKITYLNIYANYGRSHDNQLTNLQNIEELKQEKKYIRKLFLKSFFKILFSKKIISIDSLNNQKEIKIGLKNKIYLLKYRLFYHRYHSSFPYYGLIDYFNRFKSLLRF